MKAHGLNALHHEPAQSISRNSKKLQNCKQGVHDEVYFW